MRDIPEQIEALDALISQHLDREIDKLDTVEHAILLIGSYELQNRLEIPYKVVLDEAMKLNNHFGATDAHKLINAVLDKMAVELRATEVESDSKANLRTSQKAAAKPVVKTDANTDHSTDTQSIEEKPTASNKPRISANNATVKRNSASKASANISDFKANKKDTAENTVENNSVETETVAEPIVEKSIVKKNIVVDEQPVEENGDTDAVSNDRIEENTPADIDLMDSNIVSPDETVSPDEFISADEKSQD